MVRRAHSAEAEVSGPPAGGAGAARCHADSEDRACEERRRTGRDTKYSLSPFPHFSYLSRSSLAFTVSLSICTNTHRATALSSAALKRAERAEDDAKARAEREALSTGTAPYAPMNVLHLVAV